ncbi:hypothetical protein VPH35_010828 [Triticum aestivum]|uniref:Uncharacterized protein n=1 Tax=Triticum turgidum subsp. durum TaxID=4567 RepID=A0A9R0R5F8_TRITD|nr:unnamed protein product [Triticum turgidum subsp. durum]
MRSLVQRSLNILICKSILTNNSSLFRGGANTSDLSAPRTEHWILFACMSTLQKMMMTLHSYPVSFVRTNMITTGTNRINNSSIVALEYMILWLVLGMMLAFNI